MAAEARERTEQAIHKRQQAAAGQVDGIAGALRRTANGLDDDQAWIANGMERAANGLDNISEQLKNEDFNSLTKQVVDYTRREPVVVLTGAAVAGFLLSRFMKSSPSRSPVTDQQSADHSGG